MFFKKKLDLEESIREFILYRDTLYYLKLNRRRSSVLPSNLCNRTKAVDFPAREAVTP